MIRPSEDYRCSAGNIMDIVAYVYEATSTAGSKLSSTVIVNHDKPEYTTGVARRQEPGTQVEDEVNSDICAGGDNDHKAGKLLLAQAIIDPRIPSPRRAAVRPRMSATKMAKVTTILVKI